MNLRTFWNKEVQCRLADEGETKSEFQCVQYFLGLESLFLLCEDVNETLLVLQGTHNTPDWQIGPILG